MQTLSLEESDIVIANISFVTCIEPYYEWKKVYFKFFKWDVCIGDEEKVQTSNQFVVKTIDGASFIFRNTDLGLLKQQRDNILNIIHLENVNVRY